jgi:serine/threonine-protein kinase
MLARATAPEFLRAPVGRYVRGPTYVVWCVDGALCGATYWGRPSESDARAAVRLFAIDEHPEMRAPFDVLTDARRVEALDGAAFGVLARHLRRKSADYAARIRRNAIVHPDGLLGAAIAGLYSIVTPAHSWRPFVGMETALAWLERPDAAALASELGALAAKHANASDAAPSSRRAPVSGSLRKRAEARVGESVCDRYRLTRLIGIGGMGAVYAGQHRNGHLVAIKILHERLSDRPDLERSLRREALLANRVKHPAIVPVLDDDVTDDGCVFLVMPLLTGETLRARWERHHRRLPIEDVAATAHRVLGALAAAHGAKIVHRDVKPENVFLTRDGELHLLDFGLARLLETPDPLSASLSGHAIGTPAFMAPEQALGRVREIDARTDLWAVGATMYALASGQLVHDGTTASEVLVSAATKPARSVRTVAPFVPEGLAAVVDRALAFEKGDRWPSAEAMGAALVDAVARDLGVSASGLPRLGAPDGDADDAVAPYEPTERLHAVTTRTLRPPFDARSTRRSLAIAGLVVVLLGLVAWMARRSAR